MPLTSSAPWRARCLLLPFLALLAAAPAGAQTNETVNDLTVLGNAQVLGSTIQQGPLTVNSTFTLNSTGNLFGSTDFFGRMTARNGLEVRNLPLDIFAPLRVHGFTQTTLDGPVQFDGTIEADGTDAAAFRAGACLGQSCSPEPLSYGALQIDDPEAAILFGANDGDWSIEASQGAGSIFTIRDGAFDDAIFSLEAGAPQSAFWLAASGRVGMGTAIPQAALHIFENTGPAIRMEKGNSGGATPQSWELGVDPGRFVLRDVDTGNAPLSVHEGAPQAALAVDPGGDIGLGTLFPTAALHLIRADNTAQLLVEDTGASGAQEMLKLSNNGGSYFTFENAAAGTTWFFTHEDASPNRFIIADAVADGPEFTLTAGGDVTIPGNFISGNTTLNVPDYVFADDYALRPLSEVAAFIADNKHLPDVPSAADIAEHGLDMTDMQMRLLQKVEELTLYTLEQEAARRAQETELAGMRQEIAALRALLARNARED
ncbi:hypothetical protein ACOXXX_18310 [Thalassococcus sp. BH17M4-6]|uniref:hypothetical protein n=1 Tax=Thalassococcus sp. BH17M4-6 TaxID=3413148 RepID=UPI003BC6FDDD